jgi:hypothetical protein
VFYIVNLYKDHAVVVSSTAKMAWKPCHGFSLV